MPTPVEQLARDFGYTDAQILCPVKARDVSESHICITYVLARCQLTTHTANLLVATHTTKPCTKSSHIVIQ